MTAEEVSQSQFALPEMPDTQLHIVDIVFNPNHLASLYHAENYAILSEEYFRILLGLHSKTILSISAEEIQNLEVFLQVFLTSLCNERYQIIEPYASKFIVLSAHIGTLVSFSRFKTTDEILAVVAGQPNNLVKLLLLYSHYNHSDMNIADLYHINPNITYLWWVHTVAAASFTNASEHTHQKLQAFYSEDIITLMLKPQVLASDMPWLQEQFVLLTSYIAATKEKLIREKTYALIQEQNIYGSLDFCGEAVEKKNVLVVTANFRNRHAVYKAIAPLLYSLKEDYTLTLAHLTYSERTDSMMDRELFDEVIFLTDAEDGRLPTKEKLDALRAKNFGIAFFPDIGLNSASLYLSAMRLAPIQISSYGHPVSSRSPCIDYTIASQEVEELDALEENYSERVVFIPGLAALPVKPEYDLQKPELPDDVVRISCSWGNAKIDIPHLERIKQIIERTQKNVMLHFIGLDVKYLFYVTAAKQLREFFGPEHVLPIPQKPYEHYMAHIEECHIGIDAFPFGSYNRIMDTLWCRKPIVVLNGNKAYNRLAGVILRRLGLEELVAKTDEEFIEKSLKLVEDDAYRQEITNQIEILDFEATLFDLGDAKYFKTAFDYIGEQHETLQKDMSKKPIRIEKED